MPRILDRFGNPIEKEVLREHQTSRLANLYTEFAGHPSRGLTPSKLAAILDEAEQGNLMRQHELFLDMEEKDAHLFAEMSKRRRAILGIDWSIEPPRNPDAKEKRDAEELNELIQAIPDIEDTLLDALDGIGHGYAMLEIDWSEDPVGRLPDAIHHRPQSWFTIPQDKQNEIRLRDNTAEGAELWEFGWIRHVHRARSGYIARGGLHRVLAWPYLFKAYSARDLAELLQIYGIPVRLGLYPANASDEEKSTLLRAVTTIGHHAAGIIPEGMAIEFKDAAKAQNDLFSVMIDWCERSTSKAILGGTLTSQTDKGGGAYALGNVHNEVRRDLLVSDAMQLGSTLTRDLVYPIGVLNSLASDPRRAPRFVFDTREPADIKLFSESIPPLVNAGVRIPEKWAREKLAIPEADDAEDVLTPVPVGTDAAKHSGQDRAAALVAALRSQPGGAPDRLDLMIDRLNSTADAPVTAMIDTIKRLVMEVDSFEELQDRLLDLYGHLDPNEDLPRVMQLAFAAADLAGRWEVSEVQ